ncbi:hypothetical protein RBH29_01765 [Herbivorax sp. ANBcel31]|uniref:hypothetical protein n=1 Tax=Herbivorax sp. ANBcel31 TaxID=3069754 RepID=UPI0027AEB56D|nr:hypothetical protein [Herbivorax sp. ANBcel31]MDQ2085162.1 hypothetical protein [Herbivorax sp. ANBcel31]
MTGTLVLNNSSFVELTNEDMMLVDGGSLGKALAATAGAVCIGIAPVVGVIAGMGGSVVGTPVVGVAAGVAAGAGMVAAGSNMLDWATR